MSEHPAIRIRQALYCNTPFVAVVVLYVVGGLFMLQAKGHALPHSVAEIYGWFGVLWLGVIWQAVHGREPVRSQFLMTLALVWILLGTGMAMTMSSAGPVYFGRVTGVVDPHEPLMAYLRMVDGETSLHAIAIQESLWTWYTEWGRITAMPSLHLAIITAVILAGIRTHRWLALGLVPFGIMILVGSVHLGWHYAIDSYVGIGATLLLWWVCGHLMRAWQARRPEFNTLTHGT